MMAASAALAAAVISAAAVPAENGKIFAIFNLQFANVVYIK
jgi:hypothetical protein